MWVWKLIVSYLKGYNLPKGITLNLAGSELLNHKVDGGNNHFSVALLEKTRIYT